jgi:hypothetical protein
MPVAGDGSCGVMMSIDETRFTSTELKSKGIVFSSGNGKTIEPCSFQVDDCDVLCILVDSALELIGWLECGI